MGNTVFFLFSLHVKIENLLQGFHVYDISGIWQVLRGIIQIVEKEPYIGLKKKILKVSGIAHVAPQYLKRVNLSQC